MEHENQKQLVSDRAMARQIGVPIGWLKAEAEAGRVPSLKAGRTHIFNPVAVVAALSERAAGKAVSNG